MSATCNREMRLADGRILQAQTTGAADGQAVLLLHGALGSRLVHDPLAAAAGDVGIRLLSYRDCNQQAGLGLPALRQVRQEAARSGAPATLPYRLDLSE